MWRVEGFVPKVQISHFPFSLLSLILRDLESAVSALILPGVPLVEETREAAEVSRSLFLEVFYMIVLPLPN